MPNATFFTRARQSDPMHVYRLTGILFSMSKPKVQAFVAFVGSGREVIVLFLLAHGVPSLLPASVAYVSESSLYYRY